MKTDDGDNPQCRLQNGNKISPTSWFIWVPPRAFNRDQRDLPTISQHLLPDATG